MNNLPQDLILKNSNSIEDIYLNSVLFITRNNPQIFKFIFNEDSSSLNMPSNKILQLANNYSPREQIIIRMALDLWDESGKTSLVDAFFYGGEELVIDFLKAIRYRTSA